MEVKLGEIASVASLSRNDRQQKKLTWTDDPSVQKLLDVISSIIADEYIEIAKRNPDVFSSGSDTNLNIQEDGSDKSDPCRSKSKASFATTQNGFDESNPYRGCWFELVAVVEAAGIEPAS